MNTRDRPELSVAMSTETDAQLRRHLCRADGQEDVCFALWHTSVGANRKSLLLSDVVLPRDGERSVHGNASFESRYFLRASQAAAESNAGLALLHSHPAGVTWQELSPDDRRAEFVHAAKTTALTGRPLLGLTIAGQTRVWSAREWAGAPGQEAPTWADSIRIVGGALRISRPVGRPRARAPADSLTCTTSAWGDEVQQQFEDLRVGVIGVGSVGAVVAEALVRIGVGSLLLLDFDRFDSRNLDRALHATHADASRRQFKVEVVASSLRGRRSSPNTVIEASTSSIVEAEGFLKALDCDVLFSCVDRPWPRHVLNFIAYAHLVPVIDGGVAIDAGGGMLRGAEWRAHIAAPGRRCLVCLGQVDPGLVGVERSGLLDNPKYIRELPVDHVLRRGENVFPFAAAAASAEMLQLITMIAAPAGIVDVGAQTFHLATGSLDRDERDCEAACPYQGEVLSGGDDLDLAVTGRHQLAEQTRAAVARPSMLRRRLGRFLSLLAEKAS